MYWRVSSTAKLILSTNCIIKHIPVAIRGITLCMSHKPNMQKKHLSGRTQLYPDRISLLILIRIQNFIDKGLVNTQNLLKKNVFKSVSFQSVSYLITYFLAKNYRFFLFSRRGPIHRRRIYLEDKAKVFASDWGTESLPH